MRKRQVLLFSLLTALILGVSGGVFVLVKKQQDPRPVATAQSWQPIALSENEVIALVNARRADARVGSLTENDLLDKSAAAKCQDMIDRNYFDHQSPSGLQSWNFIENAGYKYNYEGENLAEEFWDGVTVGQLVDGWMNSPAHKHALLNSNYVDTGFAICNDPAHQRAFAVEHFGSPR